MKTLSLFKSYLLPISQVNCWLISKRLICLSYNNIPKYLQEQLDYFQKFKLIEFNHLNDCITNNGNNATTKEIRDKYNALKPIVDIISDIDINKNESEYLSKNICDNADESDMIDLFRIENEQLTTQTDSLYNKLISLLIPANEMDEISDITLEILSGAGGQEAMLFAAELLSAYQQFAIKKGWIFEEEFCNKSDLGGLRSCKYNVVGDGVFGLMKYEAGVHRVQRIPITSTLGKLHTSTIAVVILPNEEENFVGIKETDIKWETFRSSGPGGQHANKIESAVRLTHIPTKISVSCQNDKLQSENRKTALNQLTKILYEKYHEERLQRINKNRKIFIGSRARSDKIRTYNYQQDRITEHRIHKSWSNINEIMEQGNLDSIIESLQEIDVLDQLESALQNDLTEKLIENK